MAPALPFKMRRDSALPLGNSMNTLPHIRTSMKEGTATYASHGCGNPIPSFAGQLNFRDALSKKVTRVPLTCHIVRIMNIRINIVRTLMTVSSKTVLPAAAQIGIFTSGGVPVRRTPIGLARLFFQICTTAAAEPLARAGLTPLQFGALVYLSREIGEPDIDQSGLAARLAIDRASTSALVDELEAMGLLERRVNSADRRARLLRLTSRGERLRARLHPEQIAAQMNVLASLTPREREVMISLLVRVIKSNSGLARPGAARRRRGFRAIGRRQEPSIIIDQ
jgi:DNA-binding MarR family transcriptional regulator